MGFGLEGLGSSEIRGFGNRFQLGSIGFGIRVDGDGIWVWLA